MLNKTSTNENRLRRWTRYLLPAVLGMVILPTLLTWSAGSLAKSNLGKRYPAPGQMVDVGGYKMHLYCVGQGSPTVILAAGLDDFSIGWSLVQPVVAKTTRVCSYDRAGLGWSESSPEPRTSENMLKELHTLLVNGKVYPPYVLVDHSFGGALVRLYAQGYPDEVKGMVLVDSAPDDLFNRVPVWRNAIEQNIRMFRILASLNSLGFLALAPEKIPNYGLPADALDQYRAILVATLFFQIGIDENVAFEENLAGVRLGHRYSLEKMPVVVLSRGYWDDMPISESDNQRAWQAWQEMQSNLVSLSSDSKQIVAEQSEHFIQLQEPQLVIDAIREIVVSIGK